jgi:hypothetical protein
MSRSSTNNVSPILAPLRPALTVRSIFAASLSPRSRSYPAIRSPAIERERHISGAQNLGAGPTTTTRYRPLPCARYSRPATALAAARIRQYRDPKPLGNVRRLRADDVGRWGALDVPISSAVGLAVIIEDVLSRVLCCRRSDWENGDARAVDDCLQEPYGRYRLADQTEW